MLLTSIDGQKFSLHNEKKWTNRGVMTFFEYACNKICCSIANIEVFALIISTQILLETRDYRQSHVNLVV